MIFTNKVSPYIATFSDPKTDFFKKHLLLSEDFMLKEIYGVKTKISRNDALKLYEMAYNSKNILELGCFQGGSTYVMATACQDSGIGTLTSVDLSSEALPIAKQLIEKNNLKVNFYHNDAVKQVDLFVKEGITFDFVFVDHDHAYESVYNVCLNLDKIIKEGYVFFHDYQDYRNADPKSQVQVYKAVQDGLNNFEFCGLFGQGGLFKRN